MVVRPLLALALAAGASPSRGGLPAADCRHLPAPPTNTATSNENRSRAGTLRDGVLTVRLVARAAAWRPDGPNGCALAVRAFAEEGRPARVPGPMIRVTAGTEVRATVRNALPTPIWVRGLQDRNARILDSVEVAPGATRDFRFVATAPGAWYYWAGSVAARVPTSDADGQLVGALVVDPAGDSGAAAGGDRVMVMTRWTPTGTPANRGFQLNALNGRSWPNTERLTYTVGDSVRWHVINASDALHEMHLHGFFFRTEGRGLALRDSTVPTDRGATLVTGVLRPGEWLSLAWSPDRVGNWLYHCHLLTHMSSAQRLDRMPGATAVGSAAASAHHHGGADANHANDDMAGLVLALDVRPTPRRGATPVTSAAVPPRVFDLFATTRARVFGDRPGYGFVLQEGPSAPAADSIRIPGTPLVLTRGEPVRITVHNRLPTPVAVHWHGIELESYFDGVGGFSGMGRRVAPMIAPNDSFVVRFTPPRAGTYMYHVHGERGEELASGLYGPLLVLEPGAPYDPRTDRVFVLADGGPGAGAPVFINGTVTPDTAEMVAGTTYRLRIVTISTDESFVTTLRGPAGGGPVTWRLLARDGHDVPSARAVEGPARYVGGPGHTRDVAFTPGVAGDYALTTVHTVGGQTTGPVTTVPIRVRAP
jgi:manganese oxidase